MPKVAVLLEPLLSWLAEVETAQREIVLASLFLAVVMCAGTIGYVVLEGWSFMDGLYMTFITLTTIGFQEVGSLSNVGRVFTILIGISGIGSVAFIATRSAQVLLAGQQLRQRHMNRKISQLKDHYILCGYGRIGRRIAQDLLRAGKSFVAIEQDQAKVDDQVDRHTLIVHGNAEDEDVLQAAGIARARGLILTLPEDSANVFVTLSAREINPDIFILVRTDAHKNRQKLIHAGADKVISPYEIGADRMAQVILRPNVDQFMERVLQTGALGLQMEEVGVEPNAPLAGRSLAESNFRQQFDAIVVAIIDAETSEMRFNPSAQTKIKPGDILIVLGNQEMINRLIREGCKAP